MKKILSVAVALMLLLSLTVFVSADEHVQLFTKNSSATVGGYLELDMLAIMNYETEDAALKKALQEQNITIMWYRNGAPCMENMEKATFDREDLGAQYMAEVRVFSDYTLAQQIGTLRSPVYTVAQTPSVTEPTVPAQATTPAEPTAPSAPEADIESTAPGEATEPPVLPQEPTAPQSAEPAVTEPVATQPELTDDEVKPGSDLLVPVIIAAVLVVALAVLVAILLLRKKR